MGIIETVLVAMIAVALFGILTALKSGFSELIKALESIDERLGGDRAT
jgi:VIT1/CCC1 family predicted Fe2+/Mn2+ transporter